MADQFAIVDVSQWPRERDEQMGSKPKFWCRSPDNQRLWLFKFGRPNTGEDWAEKLAAEIASLLGLPHAHVELATCESEPGSLSLDFTEEHRRGNLVHGNELMLEIDPTYPAQQTYRLAQHTLNKVLQVLEQDFIRLPSDFLAPSAVHSAVDLFVGYLLLDALINNTDRHHENWAIIEHQVDASGTRLAGLAPTFDHASSLGRELPDETRLYKLRPGRSDQTIEGYLARASSAFYAQNTDPKPLHPLDALYLAATRFPRAGEAWLDRLRATPIEKMEALIAAIPKRRMSPPARKFTLRLLELNRTMLLERASHL